MSLISNSFTIDPIKGQLTQEPNFDTFSCQVDADESGTLVPAQPVILVDTAGDQIPVEAISAVDDDIFGFIPSNFKVNEYEALNQVKVVRNGVMFMEASAAIARGADVEVVISGTKVVTQTSGTTIGKALDKAAADGDLIRVLITL